MLFFAIPWSISNLRGDLDELAKKESSKEKILTHTQRLRFDTIFPNYHEHFRPRVAAGTTAQVALPPSTANNETAAIGGGDNNLPRMFFSMPSILSLIS